MRKEVVYTSNGRFPFFISAVSHNWVDIRQFIDEVRRLLMTPAHTKSKLTLGMISFSLNEKKSILWRWWKLPFFISAIFSFLYSTVCNNLADSVFSSLVKHDEIPALECGAYFRDTLLEWEDKGSQDSGVSRDC